MKIHRLLALAVIALAVPQMAGAVIYVNTEAPGVHLEKDQTTGENVWRSANGGYLGKESESKPLKDMNKFYIYDNNFVDKNSPYAPKKEWDSKRGCYVWKSVDGGFLGNDISSITDDDLKWLSEQDLDWWDETTIPENKKDLIESLLWDYQERQIEAQHKNDTDALKRLKEKEMAQLEKKKAAEKKRQEAETEATLRKTDAQMEMTDAEVRKAQQELEKARAELRALGMTEYEGLLDEAQSSIKQAQGASNQYKQKRKK